MKKMHTAAPKKQDLPQVTPAIDQLDQVREPSYKRLKTESQPSNWSVISNPPTLVSQTGDEPNCLPESSLILRNLESLQKQNSEAKVNTYLDANPLNLLFIKREKGRLPYSVFKPHAQELTFINSVFEGRPATAFFQYPSYVKIERQCPRIIKHQREDVELFYMAFKIADNTHIYNAVVNSCKTAGWSMIENEAFNLQWTGYIMPQDIKDLNKYQKTNHFPGSTQLGRKDLLWRSMNRLRIKYPEDFSIAPMSFILSEEFDQFQADRQQNPNQLYILKPVSSSCGRGIKLVDSKTPILIKEGILASRYIMNPHLINGLKYDLRVYVLVTSFCPLKVYIYNDGLVRFATEPYTIDPKTINQKFVHLTNFSINKKNTAKFVKNNDSDSEDAEAESSKWNFAQLEAAFKKQGHKWGTVFEEMKAIILKTLISVEPQILTNVFKNPTTRNNCFELYGFDVIIDQQMKPWVLEVNVLPSLSSSSLFDKRIKTMVVCDALTIVGIQGYDKLQFKQLSVAEQGLAPFQQSMTLEKLKYRKSLKGSEVLTQDEIEMLLDIEDEAARVGNFIRVFPLKTTIHYEGFFDIMRYQNHLVSAYLAAPENVQRQLIQKEHKRVCDVVV